jgi:NAD(P)-dependent dehydrogenase (short-subunit alcohol dehydrogenase family)
MVSSHALVDVNGTSVERTFAVNHLGTMALTLALLPALGRAGGSVASDTKSGGGDAGGGAAAASTARIVTVSSRLEKNGFLQPVLEKIDPASNHNGAGASAGAGAGAGAGVSIQSRQHDTFGAYANSKQANILFTRHLAGLLDGAAGSGAGAGAGGGLNGESDGGSGVRRGVTATVVTPGMVNTQLGRWNGLHWWSAPIRWLLLPTADDGAASTIYAAVASEVEGVSGVYFGRDRASGDIAPQTPSAAATDPLLAQYLWDVSSRLLGERFKFE